MMRRMVIVLAVLAAACWGQKALAQAKGVVVDLSTGVPQRDVVIYTNHNEVDTTDWKGEYELRQPFEWAVLRHPRFMKRRAKAEEMRADTLGMIPLVNELSDVVITAKAPRISEGFFRGLDQEIAIGAASAPKGLATFDFFAPLARFDRSKRWVSKKERRKQKEILDNY